MWRRVHLAFVWVLLVLPVLAIALATLGQWFEFTFIIPPEQAEQYIMGNTGVWALYLVPVWITLLAAWGIVAVANVTAVVASRR